MKKMLKIAFVMLGTIALAFATACNKENENGGGNGGGNNGGNLPTITKKIQTVYYSEQSTYSNYNSGKIPILRWNWDNNNLLESVDVYDDDSNNTMMLRINFSYGADKRISRVDCYQYNIYLTYTYSEVDHTLEKMDLYYKDNGVDMWAASCTFSYKENYMHMLNVTIYDDDFVKNSNIDFKLLLRPFMPEPLCSCLVKFMDKIEPQRNSDYVYNVTVEFTWDGGNPTKIVGSGMGELITVSVQYDNKNFPVYGFLLGQYGSTSLFKNNPIQVSISEGHDTETEIVTYEYDNDNYPIRLTMYEADYTSWRTSVYFDYF